jgi:hypothetical protein
MPGGSWNKFESDLRVEDLSDQAPGVEKGLTIGGATRLDTLIKEK